MSIKCSTFIKNSQITIVDIPRTSRLPFPFLLPYLLLPFFFSFAQDLKRSKKAMNNSDGRWLDQSALQPPFEGQLNPQYGRNV